MGDLFIVIREKMNPAVTYKGHAGAVAHPLGWQIGDQVAESIDMTNAPIQTFWPAARSGHMQTNGIRNRSSEVLHGNTPNPSRRDWGETVPTVERGSRAGAVEVGTVNRHHPPSPIEKRGQQTVVGADEPARIGLHRQNPAVGSDPRIDDGEVDRLGREGDGGGGKEEGRCFDIPRRNVVADVDEDGIRRGGKHHALDRCNVVVTQPEIRQKSQDGQFPSA